MTKSDRDNRLASCVDATSSLFTAACDGNLSSPKESMKSVCRIVFLGAARVGKTSIIRQFLRKSFEEKYTPTVDDVFSAKFIVRNCLAQVELMDTSGGYDFPAMIRLCISKADAFVIVFANDSLESLTTASRYLDQIKFEREDYAPLVSDMRSIDLQLSSGSLIVASPPPLVVVCNKSDIPMAKTKVNEGMIMEWLLRSGLKPSQFVYASAKTDEYILDIFKALWTQNEVLKAVTFSPWTEQRRGSAAVITTDTTSKGYNSSPTEKTHPSSPNFEMANKRTSFFRNSLKLRRRNSSRSRKNKSEFIKLDCVIS